MDDAPILAAIGQLVVNWNNLESSMQTLLSSLCKDRRFVDVIAAEMRPVTLINAISAAALTSTSPELQVAIKQAVEGFDRYRDYRNYYVHGFRWTSRDVHDVHGHAKQKKTSKRKLRLYEDIVGSRRLSDLSDHISYLSVSVLLLSQAVRDNLAGKPCTPPEMPPLPRKLEKTPKAG